MRFWDSSAVVALLALQEGAEAREKQLREDEGVMVWWATAVECYSALHRLHREGAMGEDELEAATARLRVLASHWTEVEPTERVRQQGERLLRLHPLRAADSLQLAAALVSCQHQPDTLGFLTADAKLAAAARREGFPVG